MTNKYLFLLLVVATSLSSCRTFYQSAPSLTPILREKGDGNIFLSLKDAQLAYAVTEHLGIVGSVHFDNKLQSLFSDTTGTIAKLLDNNLENIESKGFKSYQYGFDQFKFRMQGFLSQPLKENAFAKSQVGVSLGLNYQFNLASKTKQRAKQRA